MKPEQFFGPAVEILGRRLPGYILAHCILRIGYMGRARRRTILKGDRGKCAADEDSQC